MGTILCIILLICMIGLSLYIAGRAFSKNTKIFDLSFGKNEWFKIHSEFYEK